MTCPKFPCHQLGVWNCYWERQAYDFWTTNKAHNTMDCSVDHGETLDLSPVGLTIMANTHQVCANIDIPFYLPDIANGINQILFQTPVVTSIPLTIQMLLLIFIRHITSQKNQNSKRQNQHGHSLSLIEPSALGLPTANHGQNHIVSFSPTN